MGEAIMASVGRSGVLPGLKWKLQTRIYTTNGQFTVPGNIRNNELRVMCYGAGGGALSNNSVSSISGGGGGYMNLKTFNNINSLEIININIGQGSYGTGGTTRFGSYLSANGGSSGKAVDGGTNRGTCSGGDGGSGGGGGPSGQWTYNVGSGGIGYQFGGGGSGGYAVTTFYPNSLPADRYEAANPYNVQPDTSQGSFSIAVAGSGGPWGGGGGGLIQFTSAWISGNYKMSGFYTKNQGLSNGKGGNGGIGNNGNNGNKIDDTELVIDRNLLKDLSNNPLGGICSAYSGGGGGGYGGAGGNGGGIKESIYNPYESSTTYRLYHIGGAGGGGGYGSNGGNGGLYSNAWASEHYWKYWCGGGGGGGGGFGGKGADGNIQYGGGGGGYGPSNYGAGGGGTAINGAYGKSGICIVQYYEMVME